MNKVEEAKELLNKYIKDQKNIYHSLESGAVLKALAQHLGEDEEIWEVAGLLHDLDWEQTEDEDKWDQHGLRTIEILKEENFELPDEVIKAISSHNGEKNGTKRESKLDYAVAAGESVTGLIYAYALMRPEKMAGMKASSLNKRYKNKLFAAKVSRELIDDRKGYIGKDYDTDTGLSQLEARYYKSDVGRFMSQDPVFWEVGASNDGKSVLTNPQLQNSYAYANNNPTTYSDPEGRLVFMGARPIQNKVIGKIGGHAYVFVIPDNPATIGNVLNYKGENINTSRPFTLGGYTPDQSLLYKDANNATDLSYALGGYQGNSKLAYIAPPPGMTQEEFDRAIVESYNGLPDEISDSYGFSGQLGATGNPNSNNTANSILAGAGVDQARISQYQRQLSVTTQRIIPGLGQALSTQSFGQSIRSGLVSILGQLSSILGQLQTSLSGNN